MASNFIMSGLIALTLVIITLVCVSMFLQNKKLAASNRSLQRDNYLFTALLENTTDCIYFKDMDSRFIRCSRVLLNLFGMSDPVAILGKTDRNFLPKNMRNRLCRMNRKG